MTNNPKIRIYKHRSYKVLRAWQSYCPCCNATEIAGTFSDIVRRTEYHVIAHQLADKLNKLLGAAGARSARHFYDEHAPEEFKIPQPHEHREEANKLPRGCLA